MNTQSIQCLSLNHQAVVRKFLLHDPKSLINEINVICQFKNQEYLFFHYSNFLILQIISLYYQFYSNQEVKHAHFVSFDYKMNFYYLISNSFMFLLGKVLYEALVHKLFYQEMSVIANNSPKPTLYFHFFYYFYYFTRCYFMKMYTLIIHKICSFYSKILNYFVNIVLHSLNHFKLLTFCFLIRLIESKMIYSDFYFFKEFSFSFKFEFIFFQSYLVETFLLYVIEIECLQLNFFGI